MTTETQSLRVVRLIRHRNRALSRNEAAMIMGVKHVLSLGRKLERLVEDGLLTPFAEDKYALAVTPDTPVRVHAVEGRKAAGPGGIIFKESCVDHTLIPYRVLASTNDADPAPGRWRWICDPLPCKEQPEPDMSHADGLYPKTAPRPVWATGPARDFAIVRANHENKVWALWTKSR